MTIRPRSHTVTGRLALLLALFLALPALAQTRHALVVGIDAYAHIVPLQRAVNDARAVAAALTEAGFRVDLQVNADEDALATAISDLAMRARQNDEVLVYFAGHGIEIGGQNYLLPADIQALEQGQEMLIRRDSIPVSDIIEALNERRVRVSLLIIDACRNNPFPQQGGRSVGGSRGLARVEGPVGTFVLFSAGAGQVAWDQLADGDPDPNSVFTRVLLPRLRQPGLGMRAMVQEVRSEVLRVARGAGLEQFPAVYDQFDGDFVIRPAAVSAVAAPAPVVPAPSGLTPAAMNSLGDDYALGRGVAQSDSVAVNWYRAAAVAGDVDAMLELAGRYFFGSAAVSQNDTAAAHWFRAAAEAGNADAMYSLGEMYEEGRGIARNDTEALRWYHVAAENGNADAMYSLGEMYEQGRGGVPQDPAVAARWFLAGERGGERWFLWYVTNRHPETIRAVQRLLRDAGHYHGALDASWGPESEAALDAYVAQTQTDAASHDPDLLLEPLVPAALSQTRPAAQVAAAGTAANDGGLWRRMQAFDPADSSLAYSPALSPDGRTLAYFQDLGIVANPRTRVTVWSVDPPSPLFSQEFSAGPGYEIRFSDSGRLLHVIVGDIAAVLNVQDRAMQFQVAAPLEGMGRAMPATAAISPLGNMLALGLASGGFRVFSTLGGAEIAADGADPHYPATRLWWTTPNAFMARAENYVLSLVNGGGEGLGAGFGPYQRLLEVSRSGAVFVTLDDNSAVVWDYMGFIEEGDGDGARGILQRIAHPDGFLVSAALSADDTRLVTLSNSSLYLWDVQTGQELLHVRAEALPEPADAGLRHFLTDAVLIDDPLAILLEARPSLFMIDPESGAVLQEFNRAGRWTVSANSRTLVTQGGQVWQR